MHDLSHRERSSELMTTNLNGRSFTKEHDFTAEESGVDLV